MASRGVSLKIAANSVTLRFLNARLVPSFEIKSAQGKIETVYYGDDVFVLAVAGGGETQLAIAVDTPANELHVRLDEVDPSAPERFLIEFTSKQGVKSVTEMPEKPYEFAVPL